jgi:heat shock protein HtpX
MTLYTHASANRWRSAVLLTAFVGVIGLLGYAVAYGFDRPEILPIAVVIALVQAWVSYFYSDSVALAISQAKPATGAQWRELNRIVENLSITAGLPKPRVFIIDDTAPNAFATGRNPQHAAIAVTTGLIDKLERSELEGVIAHELSHVGNYDIRFMSMVVVLIGIATLISDFIWHWSWGLGRDNNSEGGQAKAILFVVAIILTILAPLIGTLMQLAISRKREFMADADGALLTRYPEGLANALKKISTDTEPLEVANKATAHLYIASPLKGDKRSRGWLASLFLTHPPVEERIKALLH